MANILTLKRRIQVSQNISRTTRAIQMIAASKLKRAQEVALQGQPYVEKLTQITGSVTKKTEEDNQHEYMKTKTGNKSLVIVISPDKGLCGSLNSNLARELLNINFKNTSFIAFGRKAELSILALGGNLIGVFPFGTSLPSFNIVYPIMQLIDNNFLGNKVSEVKIISTKFVNIFSQTVKISNLLPIKIENEKSKDSAENTILFEPNLSELLPTLLRHFVEMTVYQSILEAYASEQAAKMIAMKNATDNAKEIMEESKLEYNKLRQEKITNEILDISSATFAVAYEN